MKKLLNRIVNNLAEEEKIMKIGTIVRVVKGESTIGIVGQRTEIVDLQMQEFERYRVYPVWARILAGECQGRVCGFYYDEVEVVEEKAKTPLAMELEGILAKAEEISVTAPMKVGCIVKIGKCQWRPEVVGESAEIVDLQMQEFERYRVYPVWARILGGECQGRVCGFHYDEVEVVAKESGLLETVEEILKSATTV